MSTREIPALEGYISIPQLAARIGVSRQRAHQIVKTSDAFPGARTIGESTAIVVSETDLDRYLRLNPKKIEE